MSNSTIAIHCFPIPLFAGTGRHGCSNSLHHGCETETFGLHYKQLWGFFSWHTGYLNDRRITHACQCPVLKAPVYKTPITNLAWAQHSESKEGGSNGQFCPSEEERCSEIKENSSHVAMMCSAPQHLRVFQMTIYVAESFLLLLAPCRI